MIRRPPRSTQSRSSAASDVYKRQDKTGTLTRNEMTVTELWANGKSVLVTGSGYTPEGKFKENGQKIDTLEINFQSLLNGAVLCSDSEINSNGNKWEITGDPTEAALV